jgi:hypothetical protein
VIGNFPVWINGLPETVAHEVQINRIHYTPDLPKYSSNGLDPLLFPSDSKLKKDLSSYNIKYISLVDSLCLDKQCMRYVDSSNGVKLISFDYGHLGVEGALYISRNVVGPNIVNLVKK